MRGLRGKRVVITGGASGIGAATAARFVEEGSAVGILDRDVAALDRIRSKLSNIKTYPADVTLQVEVQPAFDAIVEDMGGIDVVINNAGISMRHKFLDITAEEWN